MLREYLAALRGFRRYTAACMALLMVSGVAEGLGITALLPLLSSKLDPKAGGDREWFGLAGDTLVLASVAALVGLGLLAAWLRYLGDGRSYVLAVSVEQTLRSKMAAALLGMRWTSYLAIPVGEGIEALLSKGAQVGMGAFALVQACGNAALVIVFVVLALLISPFMTLLVLGFGAVTALLYRRAGRASQWRSRELSVQAGAVSEVATDLLTNAKFYRSTGLREPALLRMNDEFQNWSRRYARVQRYLPVTRFLFDSAGLVFIGAMLAVTLVIFDNSIADALVFLALFYRLAPRFQQAQQGFLQARTQISWWQTWKQQYDAALTAADVHTGTTRFTDLPRIEFDRVTVIYPERSTSALSSVSASIAPGECLGVVGESGAGKTSLLDVVTGLLVPTEGDVRLDGVNLRDADLEAWRDRIGLVMQDSPVFHTTVLENIAYLDPHPDEGRVRGALEMANLAEVVAALPEKIQTQVGQKGGRLSGGQRQRLALARALYRQPWLLILDEATSALDSVSEQVIQDAMLSLKGSCSVLIVAHRLKTVQIADRIIVLSRGEVVQSGTWEELIQEEGAFRRLATAQGIGSEPAGATPSHS